MYVAFVIAKGSIQQKKLKMAFKNPEAICKLIFYLIIPRLLKVIQNTVAVRGRDHIQLLARRRI